MCFSYGSLGAAGDGAAISSDEPLFTRHFYNRFITSHFSRMLGDSTGYTRMICHAILSAVVYQA